jgi:cytochrome c oxidase subunit I
MLSNYIPMLDHPLFVAGLILYAVGVGLALLEGRLLAGEEAEWGRVPVPGPARPGLRAAALALLVALLTFAASWLGTPRELDTEVYYEVLFWGGGHVLQFASVAAMVAVWLMLLTPVLGQPPVSRGMAAVLFGLLLLPVLGAPLLALHGPITATYRFGFTMLMQWGIFPAVSVFLLLCLRGLWRARQEGRLAAGWYREGRVLGFFASAALTVLGFMLGALIRGATTMVPAHYHASIGAVTAAFMAITYVLLEPLGMPIPSPRLARVSAWQPVLFGVGQAVFAIGFGLAGAHGMGRKAYGAEQAARSLPQTVGLAVMGLGGLIAVCGGLIFLWIVVTSWHRAPAAAGPLERSNPWTTSERSIPSRS